MIGTRSIETIFSLLSPGIDFYMVGCTCESRTHTTPHHPMPCCSLGSAQLRSLPNVAAARVFLDDAGPEGHAISPNVHSTRGGAKVYFVFDKNESLANYGNTVSSGLSAPHSHIVNGFYVQTRHTHILSFVQVRLIISHHLYRPCSTRLFFL